MYVNVQVQIGGSWSTQQIVNGNDSQRVTQAMQQVSSQFPGQRVRAADSFGRLVDML